MPANVTSIQPGGGIVYRLELAWGYWRRWWLKSFRQGYVSRMAALRHGDPAGCPHEILDPRDLKFYRNQTDCHWNGEDDPFVWRDRLPFARVGLAELIVGGTFFAGLFGLILAILCLARLSAFATMAAWSGLLISGLLLAETAWFFRDPRRNIPTEPGSIVSPADGRVVQIESLDWDDYIGGRAVRVGIFLSIFNVHINRVPAACRVVGLSYQPGKFLNALREVSSRENERLEVRLEGTDSPHRPMKVVQITGALARRIVCWLRPGETLARGEQFGMIKLGSRTELTIPCESGLELAVQIGARVQAGTTILARYRPTP